MLAVSDPELVDDDEKEEAEAEELDADAGTVDAVTAVVRPEIIDGLEHLAQGTAKAAVSSSAGLIFPTPPSNVANVSEMLLLLLLMLLLLLLLMLLLLLFMSMLFLKLLLL